MLKIVSGIQARNQRRAAPSSAQRQAAWRQREKGRVIALERENKWLRSELAKYQSAWWRRLARWLA